jgi:hypothetical protein
MWLFCYNKKMSLDLENFEGISFIEIDLTNVKDW